MPLLKDLYYNNIAKSCRNCFYYRPWVISLSKCKLQPNWLTADALKHCQFRDWQPNQKLYNKYEVKK